MTQLLTINISCTSRPVGIKRHYVYYNRMITCVILCSTSPITIMSSEAQLSAFITRHRELLIRERDAEIERSALLLTNCGPKLLEQKGLALNGLGIASINIGLGGKRYVRDCFIFMVLM